MIQYGLKPKKMKSFYAVTEILAHYTLTVASTTPIDHIKNFERSIPFTENKTMYIVYLMG
jgi:hypothetical protein